MVAGIFAPVRDSAADDTSDVIVPGMVNNPLTSLPTRARSMQRLNSNAMLDDDVGNYSLGLFQVLPSLLRESNMAQQKWLFLDTFFMGKLFP